jgi:hypothetical protein
MEIIPIDRFKQGKTLRAVSSVAFKGFRIAQAKPGAGGEI